MSRFQKRDIVKAPTRFRGEGVVLCVSLIEGCVLVEFTNRFGTLEKAKFTLDGNLYDIDGVEPSLFLVRRPPPIIKAIVKGWVNVFRTGRCSAEIAGLVYRDKDQAIKNGSCLNTYLDTIEIKEREVDLGECQCGCHEPSFDIDEIRKDGLHQGSDRCCPDCGVSLTSNVSG